VIYSTRLWAGFTFIHLLDGELASALDAGRQIQNIATDRQSLYAESWGSYVESLIYLTWYDLQKAEQHFIKLVNDRYVMHTRASIDSLFALALVYQIMQQPDKADKTMEILHEFSRQTNDLTYLSIASSCQAHLSLLRKDISSAVRWQKAADLTLDEGNMLWWLEVPRLTECRVLIAEGSDDSLKDAVAKLQKFEQENAAIHNTFQMVHILSLLALAFRKQEYIDKASATLKRALELAEPGGFIMSFTNMGPLMTDLLKRLVSQNICVDFIGKLLTVVEDAKQVVVSEAAKPKVAPTAAMDSELIIEPLTNRELAILELLEQRLQTKEIADRLFISAETVKKHLQHIYQKLYASNRREAVSKARALGILIS
jgi:LuxR family maltose regulon positive regulatory protein